MKDFGETRVGGFKGVIQTLHAVWDRFKHDSDAQVIDPEMPTSGEDTIRTVEAMQAQLEKATTKLASEQAEVGALQERVRAAEAQLKATAEREVELGRI